MLRDTQLVQGGQDPPAPHCSPSPRVRDSPALCHLLLPLNQVSSASLSASGHSCWAHMALTLTPTLAVQLVLPSVCLPSFPRLPLVSKAASLQASAAQGILCHWGRDWSPSWVLGSIGLVGARPSLAYLSLVGDSVMAAVGLAGPLSSGFRQEGTTLCLKLRRPSEGQGRAGALLFFRVLLMSQLTKMSHSCHPILSCGSQMEWSQDYPFVPSGAEAHCLSPLPRTNSDSALHQSTMTPTQPEPFTGGSQDAHQKRGIGRAHGHFS